MWVGRAEGRRGERGKVRNKKEGGLDGRRGVGGRDREGR